MQKTITITINKLIFYIEEEAYQILREYLDSIKEYFKSSPDTDEIIADMESNISEKFLEKTSKTEKVITKADVLELIKIMGSVKDIENESDSSFIAKEKDGSNTGLKNKKLYRDPDDVIIAGVCSGIAAYFGIDPVIVRFIFAISVFFGGAGIFVYLILWAIVPEAKGSSQKLEMRGDLVTLKKIEENIREKINKYKKEDEEDKNNNKKENKLQKIIASFLKFLTSFFYGFNIVFKNLFKILSVIIGIVLFISAILLVVCLTFGALVMLFDINSLSAVTNFPIKEISSFGFYPLFIGSVYLLIAIPIIFLLFLAFSLIKRKNSLSGLMSGFLLSLWMLSIITMGVISVDSFPRVKSMIDEYREAHESDQIILHLYEIK